LRAPIPGAAPLGGTSALLSEQLRLHHLAVMEELKLHSLAVMPEEFKLHVAQLNAVRVGGDIKPPLKTRDAKPVYPPIAKDAQVQGGVILEILVDVDGKVIDQRILHSIPLLDQAALEAARQWEYTPTLLNGNPVSVLMTATVNFSLQ
jgi:TonB family protein